MLKYLAATPTATIVPVLKCVPTGNAKRPHHHRRQPGSLCQKIRREHWSDCCYRSSHQDLGTEFPEGETEESLFASSFNQGISGWNTSQLSDMSFMFDDASSFTGGVGGRNTSQIHGVRSLFAGASSFYQVDPITGHPHELHVLCCCCFNQGIGGWETSQVRSVSYMLVIASGFYQGICGWNTSQVSDISSFNQGIGGWNTSQASELRWM